MNYYLYYEYLESPPPRNTTTREIFAGFRFAGESRMDQLRHYIGDERLSVLSLYTVYPGLIIGASNDLGRIRAVDEPPNRAGQNGDTPQNYGRKEREQIQWGFSFDYVSGMPFIAGSVLKGKLRSRFPGREANKIRENYIRSLYRQVAGDAEIAEQLNVGLLESAIFGIDGVYIPWELKNNQQDVFLGAYPRIMSPEGDQLVDVDVINAHSDGPYRNTFPNLILKIKPNVCLDFGFMLHDHQIGAVLVTKEQLREIFLRILLDVGIGTRVNVGYGQLSPAPRDASLDIKEEPRLNEPKDDTN